MDLKEIDTAGFFIHIVTWLLVFVGWYLVDKQNDKRECRREHRTALDHLTLKLHNLEMYANGFHQSPFNPQQSSSIEREIQKISGISYRLDLVERADCEGCIKVLRQAITMNNFDRSTHRQLVPDDPILQGIGVAVDEIVALLETGFQKKYPL